jgi:hypothetical protein
LGCRKPLWHRLVTSFFIAPVAVMLNLAVCIYVFIQPESQRDFPRAHLVGRGMYDLLIARGSVGMVGCPAHIAVDVPAKSPSDE